jgi:hypothetical protein
MYTGKFVFMQKETRAKAIAEKEPINSSFADFISE